MAGKSLAHISHMLLLFEVSVYVCVVCLYHLKVGT